MPGCHGDTCSLCSRQSLAWQAPLHKSLHVPLQVSKQQICTDLATPPLEWDQPFRAQHYSAEHVAVSADPYDACHSSHAIAVMTEWDEFRGYNWNRIYSSMVKPAFVFDGR